MPEELQNNVYKKSLIKDKCYTLAEKIDTDTQYIHHVIVGLIYKHIVQANPIQTHVHAHTHSHTHKERERLITTTDNLPYPNIPNACFLAIGTVHFCTQKG